MLMTWADQSLHLITIPHFVIEMSKSSWLVAGMIPGVDRQSVKKLYRLPELLTPW